MSLTVETAPATRASVAAEARPRRPIGTWARVVLAVALLVGAGGVRAWQARRIDDFLRLNQDSPFPLENIPMDLGDWKGKDATLDPEIARATGCKDSISRIYVDARTGQEIQMIVLFGPPVEITEHTPENCYPHAGWITADGPVYREVKAGTESVPFTSLLFEKGQGGAVERQEVYYNWHYGRWTAFRGTTKQIERIPGMYKVHVARGLSSRETLEPDGPCEAFLALLIPEMERRMDAARDRVPARPATTAAG